MNDNDLFGPGTDLVLALSAVLIILVTLLSYLYRDTAAASTVLANEIAVCDKEKTKILARTLLGVSPTDFIAMQNDVEQLKQEKEALQKQNAALETDFTELQIQNTELGKKYEAAVKPARSKVGKKVVRVRFSKGQAGTVQFWLRPVDSQSEKRLTRAEVHSHLAKDQKRFGDALYVAVFPDDALSHGQASQLSYEFLAYDYYRLPTE